MQLNTNKHKIVSNLSFIGLYSRTAFYIDLSSIIVLLHAAVWFHFPRNEFLWLSGERCPVPVHFNSFISRRLILFLSICDITVSSFLNS